MSTRDAASARGSVGKRLPAIKSRWLVLLTVWLGAAALFVLVALPAHRAAVHLREPALITGYALLALILFLGAFNVRKRLSMLPLLRAHWWTIGHLVGGVLAVALYFLHTGSLWPSGPYEQALAVLFFVVSLSGAAGYIILRVFPHRLTGTRAEVIYERIPAEIADLRAAAEEVVLQCTKSTRADTLARYYVETFDWYFRRPRFVLSQLSGGHKGAYWLEQQFTNSRSYLNDSEREYLKRLQALAELKSRLDFHYAAQGLMKAWLLVHVPAVAALLVFSLWHLALVNIYAL